MISEVARFTDQDKLKLYREYRKEYRPSEIDRVIAQLQRDVEWGTFQSKDGTDIETYIWLYGKGSLVLDPDIADLPDRAEAQAQSAAPVATPSSKQPSGDILDAEPAEESPAPAKKERIVRTTCKGNAIVTHTSREKLDEATVERRKQLYRDCRVQIKIPLPYTDDAIENFVGFTPELDAVRYVDEHVRNLKKLLILLSEEIGELNVGRFTAQIPETRVKREKTNHVVMHPDHAEWELQGLAEDLFRDAKELRGLISERIELLGVTRTDLEPPEPKRKRGRKGADEALLTSASLRLEDDFLRGYMAFEDIAYQHPTLILSAFPHQDLQPGNTWSVYCDTKDGRCGVRIVPGRRDVVDGKSGSSKGEDLYVPGGINVRRILSQIMTILVQRKKAPTRDSDDREARKVSLDSLTEVLTEYNLSDSGGKSSAASKLQEVIECLVRADIELIVIDKQNGKACVRSMDRIFKEIEYSRDISGSRAKRWPTAIWVSREFYQHLTSGAAVPLHSTMLKTISNTIAHDMLVYLSYQLPRIPYGTTQTLSWRELIERFTPGRNPNRPDANRRAVERAFTNYVVPVYRLADIDLSRDRGLVMRRSPPTVPDRNGYFARLDNMRTAGKRANVKRRRAQIAAATAEPKADDDIDQIPFD